MNQNFRFAVAVVIVFSAVTPSYAQTTPLIGGGSAPGGGDAHGMPCIKKLMPCQPYLHSVIPPPPPSCCLPLKEIVESDVNCLCSVFNNVDMLKSLNLTKENALVLPKACGANADVTLCKNKAGSTTTPATPNTPPASTEAGNSSTGGSSTSTAKAANSAPTMNFAGLTFASAFMALATIFF